MTVWRRLVGHRPIVTRLVLAVAATMTVVLLATGAFVFWRVEFALNRQLDQDLRAYQEVVERSLATGNPPPSDTPGQSYQVYDIRGRVIAGNTSVRLVDPETVTQAAAGTQQRVDVGNIYPPADHPYRVVTTRVKTTQGVRVVASAISKSKHDEALRELLFQLVIADLITLIAASLVGYGTARAALNPVERYRVAAESADGAPVLPVDPGKDDEVTRLGHTFNALLDRIRRSNERERQFLADASHELRSPLALMRTELEMALLKPRGAAETRTALESLRGQVERLITLSNALLDLEELRASGTATTEPVDLEELVAEVTSRYAAAVSAEGRAIEMHVAPGLRVEGNEHWLRLGLDNLVSNALRYGAGTITVAAGQHAGGTRLSVRDEGTGLPEDFVAKAFDRFSRAETSRTSGGTGLGLALVKAVAEAHGGTATVEGTQVMLDLAAPATTP
jgi:signal transduction histidine kinase